MLDDNGFRGRYDFAWPVNDLSYKFRSFPSSSRDERFIEIGRLCWCLNFRLKDGAIGYTFP